ncbi:MAG: ABC transporter ATP-binding protein [Deltaproteobacteria bacterium]|jgi:putative ABC transport system ATP-binding protein|nr:ABC transporter ATP-binding protein [Deltaproteobacteria bacterium]
MSPEESNKDSPPAVKFENLAFHWPGEKPILTNLNLSLESGEKIFITGPSGCGKSTLLSLAAGILTPQEGEVYLAGKALSGLSGPKRDRLRGDCVGYIFQQFNLVPYLTPLENVMLPCRFSQVRRQSALSHGRNLEGEAESLLMRLSIPKELLSKAAAKLSVGQQQRVAAARALIGSPRLLIADEPTSALDYELGLQFLRLLMKECDEAGSSLLFVSHDKSLAAEFPRNFTLGPQAA